MTHEITFSPDGVVQIHWASEEAKEIISALGVERTPIVVLFGEIQCG